MLTKIGIENDETVFSGSVFKPYDAAWVVRIGHSHFPLMVMTYIGTLKAWIYRPLVSLFGTGLVALRLPVLLVGTASVWLFFRLLERIAGLRAAVIGCALLAADSTYLLTICFDWGPVAFQHLLLISGLLLLMRYYQERKEPTLFWGCCMLGLGMWDKALAVWMLSGSAVAAAVLFPRQILALLTRRRLAIAALGFGLGAGPLILYNLNNHWATFAGNIQHDTSDLPGRARLLKETAKGDGLFGWMFNEGWQTPAPHAPQGAIERASAKISSLFGHPRIHLLYYGFLLAVLLIPLARGPALRGVLFALVAMALAWLQMATNAHTGGSVHHTILLWPYPQMVIALSFAAASRRLGRAGLPIVAVVAAAMTFSAVLVGNEYYFVSYSYGAAPAWSESIVTANDYMKNVHPGNVYCVDWGLLDPLRFLSHGRLHVTSAVEISTPTPTDDDRPRALAMIADPGAVFLAHTKDFENFPGRNDRLLQFAAAEGYRREMLTTIKDSFQRPAIEVYRFVPAEPAE